MLNAIKKPMHIGLFAVLGMLLAWPGVAAGQTATSIYTPRGSRVAATLQTYELSSAEIASMNNYVATNYPRATRLRNASRRYNCHSYAWHSQSTANSVWLNSPGDDQFWLDGSYGAVATPPGGARISYVYGDHSAIYVASSNATSYQAESKWGQLPLMRHNLNYCPYNSSQLRFYVRR